MKFIKKFATDTDYQSYIGGGGTDYVEPHIALIKDSYSVVYKRKEPIELYTQVINLQEGWNYLSSYVETDLESLQKALGENGVQIKSNVDGYTSYYAGYGWDGSLNTIESSQMYMVQTSAACTIELTGKLINPLELPITIKPNTTTWISYPLNKEMSVTDALANFDGKNGDIIKGYGTTEIASYYEGKWVGPLTTLVPGQGYQFGTTNTDYSEDRTLIYPSVR